MRSDLVLMTLHGSALLFALAAALAWPRAGEAALLVPLGRSQMPAVLAWADAEQAALLTLDPSRGRVIARVPSNQSLINALRRGILPIATRTAGCSPDRKAGSSRWTN